MSVKVSCVIVYILRAGQGRRRATVGSDKPSPQRRSEGHPRRHSRQGRVGRRPAVDRERRSGAQGRQSRRRRRVYPLRGDGAVNQTAGGAVAPSVGERRRAPPRQGTRGAGGGGKTYRRDNRRGFGRRALSRHPSGGDNARDYWSRAGHPRRIYPTIPRIMRGERRRLRARAYPYLDTWQYLKRE